MDIKLQQLKYFVLVVDEGGFRAASSKANRSQAALSTAVKELEKILGQTLFETGHKVKLTPFGAICLPKIRQFLNHYRSLTCDLSAAAAGQLGQVRIGSIPSVAAKLIPKVLAAFTACHPQVEVSLIDDNAAGVELRLLAGEVDLALGNCLHINDSRIDFTPLISDPLGVVCLSDHPLAAFKNGLKWQQLEAYPFIKNGTCTLLAPTPARVLAESALYSVENITSLFSVLELGIGITTLPKLAFPTNEKELVWIPLIDPVVEREIGIFRLLDRHISPQAHAFFILCQQELMCQQELKGEGK
jgi:DNA-binding transcriptional LysR family regulator